ncbi:YhdP family phospholipid transporter [Halomonas sp. NCCP-2165]|nr:AsmA-like C-terminal region-containing protein [Halomonas sp. NCCP-2165]GKW48372.1 TIGR02099 family protein [Halomonas sp. NCCP-2165]
MTGWRIAGRWALTLLALGLLSLALIVSAWRLAAGQADALREPLERVLVERTRAETRIGALTAETRGIDPSLALHDLRLSLDERPLLELRRAELRLDTLASLRAGMPVTSRARVQGLTLHLYQGEGRNWHWPRPAELPFEASHDVDLSRLDAWIGLLLRQRLDARQVRLVLHGRERRVELQAPSLLLTGDERRLHLEGWAHVAGQEQTTLEVVAEVLPGQRGLADFNAALQARMELSSLAELVRQLSGDEPLRLERAEGEAILWGRWHRGALEDVRLALDVPALAIGHDQASLALADIRAEGQWLRDGEAWNAWLNLAASADAEGLAQGPALPSRWRLSGDGTDWWAITDGFELPALADWSERLPLPQGLVRLLGTLDPQGWVEGFAFGRRDGHWLARGALREVAVSPWEDAPGGGPLDAWVEARDLAGEVRFIGVADTTLHFPRLFTAPMALDAASGVVGWTYADGLTRVSGRDLHADWRGAEVNGDFGLVLGNGGPGVLGLELDLRDVDARDTALSEWLPMGAFGDELGDWLSGGIAGRVSRGHLALHQPLFEGAGAEEMRLDLELAIEEGRLPYLPGWPALDDVQGRLTLTDLSLEAAIDRAESRGLTIRDGRVTLSPDGELAVNGGVEGGPEALVDYLTATPLEGLEALDDWAWPEAGRLEGRLDLALPLSDPEALALDVETTLDLPRARYRPLDLDLSTVTGPLAYRYRAGEGGLEGRLEGQALGGAVTATLAGERVDFEGQAEASRLLAWGGLPGEGLPITGRLAYRGGLTLTDAGARLRLDSSLEGLALELPAPFAKSAEARRPLWLEMDTAGGRLDAELQGLARLRWREQSAQGPQGQLWLEGWPESPTWPVRPGLEISWRPARLDPAPWAAALAPLAQAGGSGASPALTLDLATDCLLLDARCLGSLRARATPEAGNWRLDLGGSLAEGQASYRPASTRPLAIELERLDLDALLPAPSEGVALFEEVAVPPPPEPLADWARRLPAGRLEVASLVRQGQRFGPLSAEWQATEAGLRLAPLRLTLGELEASGELVWEAAGAEASLTRGRLDLAGGDLGTALERLAQPVAIRNAETRVDARLAWPGAPWQFDLARSRGSLEVDLTDGHFRYIDSPSAKLIGLLNFDNLLRRLRLDFSDVTQRGTAFDSVMGVATLYDGILETQGPVEVRGPATSFSLDGQVDLARRELDHHLAVTLPLSQNLPLAAVVAGAPVVGGALFIAHRLFGGVIDRVTRIHYRVEGPWTSPRITLEDAE